NLIEFSVLTGSPFPQYEVRDDGTGLHQLAFPQNATGRYFSTTSSSYPGGRQYLYSQQYGTVKSGRNTYGLYNLLAWSEGSGQSKAPPNSTTPISAGASTSRWSNDGLDSFVSFVMFNAVTTQSATYRAHISAADIASPSFVSITSLSDPRLELVEDWGT